MPKGVYNSKKHDKIINFKELNYAKQNQQTRWL